GPGQDDSVRVVMPLRQNRVIFDQQSSVGQQTTSDSATQTANGAQFWRLLLAMCREQGRSENDVEQQFCPWIDQGGKKQGDISDFQNEAISHRSELWPDKQRDFFRLMKDLRISIQDMRSLAGRLNASILMLDSLLSAVIQDDHLVIDLKSGFFSPPP